MTMHHIASATASGSGFTFTNIPQNYTHLQVRIHGRATGAGASDLIFMRINSDFSSSNYRSHILYGDGSAAYSFDYGTGRNYLLFGMASAAGSAANVFGASIIDILDYTSTNKNKTFRNIGGFENGSSGFLHLFSGLWISTSAITSLVIDCLGSTMATGSRVDLYGITSNPIATGA